MFINTAFVSSRNTSELFENNLSNNIFVALLVLVGCVNFLSWGFGDIQALDHKCGTEDYYEAHVEERKANILR